MAVYDRKSPTLFTGLVPAYLAKKGKLLKRSCSHAPYIIKHDAIFLMKGIVPEGFVKLNRLTTIEGNMFELDVLSSVVVEKRC